MKKKKIKLPFSVNNASDVCLIRIEQEERKMGSIIIPETEKQKGKRGKVVDIGSEVTDVKVGDTVIYIGGQRMPYEGVQYVMVDIGQILGIITEEDGK